MRPPASGRDRPPTAVERYPGTPPIPCIHVAVDRTLPPLYSPPHPLLKGAARHHRAPFSLHRRLHTPLVVKHLFPPLLCLLSDQGYQGAVTAPDLKPLPPSPSLPRPSEQRLRARSCCLDLSLTSPLVHRCCRSPSPLPLTTGAPRLPRTPLPSCLLHTSPHPCRSSEPPLPPPYQAHCPNFPGACVTSPSAPCPPASPGRPRHRDHAGERAALVGLAMLLGPLG
jgi:hypothetical protein